MELTPEQLRSKFATLCDTEEIIDKLARNPDAMELAFKFCIASLLEQTESLNQLGAFTFIGLMQVACRRDELNRTI